MGLFDRFRGQQKWKHRDPAIRLAAVEELPLDEQELLQLVASEDGDFRVRRAAVKKLYDPVVVAGIRDRDIDPGVREEANTLLLDTALGAFNGTREADSLAALAGVSEVRDLIAIAREAAAERVASAALTRITDEKAVGSIARRSIHPAVRMRALGRVRDASELRAIAMRSDFKDVALAALEPIRDRETLEAIAARAKNRAAARQARSVLRALGVASQPAPAAAPEPAAPAAEESGVAGTTAEPHLHLCGLVEALRESPDWRRAAASLADLEARWKSLGDADETLARRFAAGCRQVREQGAARAADEAERALQAAAIESAVAQRTALSEQAEALLAAFEPAARPDGDTTPAPGASAEDALRRLERITAEWQRQPPLPEAFAGRAPLARRFEKACNECRRRHEQMAALRARRTHLETLSQAAESIAGLESLAEARARWSSLRQEWSVATAGTTADEDLLTRLGAADARLRGREQEAREERARRERENLARVTQLADHLAALVKSEALTLKDAERGAREVRGALEDPGPMPSRRDREEMTGRLQAIQAALFPRLQELKEADEWQRWANANVQDELCRRAEVVSRVEDPADAARQMRELQAQWKKVSTAPRDQSQVLWLRFKAAQDQVRARTDEYFAQQAEERAASLQRKEALCQKAEALAESTDWIRTAEAIKQLQAEWKTIGPVSRGQEKATWERFRAACDRFFTRRREDLVRRKEEWAKNAARREAIIAEAERLSSPADWDKASADARRLQAEWRTAGPVRKKHADELAERFQQALTRFSERFAQRDELQMAANVAAREAACAELEGLLPASGSGEPALSLEDIVARLRDCWSRWGQAGAVPTEALAPLTERFRQAFAGVVAAYPDPLRGTEFDAEANLRRMVELCERVEQLLPAEAPVSADQSPAAVLATRWREALAARTIGGDVAAAGEDAQRRAAADAVREAQAAWKRIGAAPEDLARPLAVRFQKACARFFDQFDRRPGGAPRPGR